MVVRIWGGQWWDKASTLAHEGQETTGIMYHLNYMEVKA